MIRSLGAVSKVPDVVHSVPPLYEYAHAVNPTKSSVPAPSANGSSLD